MVAPSTSWSLYPYDPIKPLPIIFGVILLIIASVQAWQCFIKYKWRIFGLTVTIASATWLAGFVCREVSIYNVQSVGVFLAQYILLFLGPPLYAAVEYFILGRALAYVPYHSPIHPGRVLSTFLALDAIVECLAANGAATAAASKTEQVRNEGLIRMEASLILQSCLEAFFFSFVVLVEVRCRRSKQFPKNLRTICYVLYVTSFMMLIRCIFRTIEAFESATCPFDHNPFCAAVDQSEWYFWVFEVANITLYVALLAIFPPGKYLPPNDNIYMDPFDENIERIGPGYSQADQRKWWITCLDPFDLGSALSTKGKCVDRFWERDDNAVYKRGGVLMEN